MISRRSFLSGISALPFAVQVSGFSLDLPGSPNVSALHPLTSYLEAHRKPNGGYGWLSLGEAHITPTFAVVGCYHILGLEVPNPGSVAEFVRSNYPLPEYRKKVRPMRTFDYQQVQTLLWLGQSVDSFRTLAAGWTQPSDYDKYYELDGYQVLKHEAMALRARLLLGVEPSPPEEAWRTYFMERRRPNGTFNNTPASDGSDGHLVNTLWGAWGMQDAGEVSKLKPETIAWIQSCQMPSGGFSYAPQPTIGGVDNLVYTWAAVQLLTQATAPLRNQEACIRWIESLWTEEGGFQDRPGAKHNLLATFYALDSLRLLKHTVSTPRHRAPTVSRVSIPSNYRVFSAQIEAPGEGSPSEAVFLAEKLGIDLWTAKNSPAGWIQEAQRVADDRKVPVLFAVGNEEYGTFVQLPGLGIYSHLDDMVAPADTNLGPFPPKKNSVYPWEAFRDGRLSQIQRAHGRMVWQFNENEELTRILLDEAVMKGTYGAISAFHFGSGNFLQYEPFLMEWEERLPMIGLQDAHGKESWWWGGSLAAFRTLFLAKEPTWDAFLDAIDRKLIMAVRRDPVTQWQTQVTGASPAVRDYVMARQDQWCWWGTAGAARTQPVAALTVLKPRMLFEIDCPSSGIAIRLRLRYSDGDNPTKPARTDPETELVSMQVDGKAVQPTWVNKPGDRYYLYSIAEASHQSVSVVVRTISTREETTLTASL